METQEHTFYSDGIRLEGLLQLPDPPAVAPYPTLVLCSGFQGLIELPTAHHLDWIQPDDPRYLDAIARIVAWLARYLSTGRGA